MKKLFITLFFLVVAHTVFANHTRGGWLYYEYLGQGNGSNTARYRITLKLYTECFLNTNQWCPNVNISIFNAGSNSLIEVMSVPYSDSSNIQNCTSQECHPCISSIPSICYKIATFSFEKDLVVTGEGYTFSYQRCCRIANIINLVPGSSSVGDTWTVTIPGTNNSDPTAYKNSSAKFSQNDTAIICRQNYFTFDFSAFDADDDSLVYDFSDAYFSPQGNNGGQCGSQADRPPYSPVNYMSPYSGSQPLGNAVTINSETGIVSGIAPATEGTYVLTCTISEFKRGTSILRSTVRKSLHINVTDCSLTQAILDPVYFSCDSFTKSFSNNATGGNVLTYFWDFGVADDFDDTSSIAMPAFTFPDTGTYTIKLVVNRYGNCPDSTIALVKVYPVFAPGFFTEGQCKNTPIRFTDLTTSTYGVVGGWSWNFGDISSPSNVSSQQNPQHIYATENLYTVTLSVANSVGCKGNFSRTVLITDKPALTVTNDTLICIIDTLQLNAIGTGSFTWSPNYNISTLSSPSTFVSPDVPFTYYVTLTDPYGCVGKDSVFVNVKAFVTLQAANDTTICRTDPVRLGVSSDALYYTWTENSGTNSLNNAKLKNPLATPLVNTIYHVIGSIGKCIAEDDISVRVVPYPLANAGPDTTICAGKSVQLNASGGSAYNWTPASFLTNRQIANPTSITPTATITYIVSVTDNVGCPKPVMDTMVVNVVKINANAGPRDTSVVIEQPLQLQATGSINYSWSPSLWLSNTAIANPVALPQNDIVYAVRVSDANGCFDVDSIRVKLFKLVPGFYVPTGFSPNNDGKNDFFKPLAIGMRTIDIFRVYNRWGKTIYEGTDFEAGGWDGTFKGNGQDPGTYVYYAEGIDFRNIKVKKRGYVVLIR